MSSRRPVIGVFDSGFGGLTVLRALAAAVSHADYLYLGDAARLPYGSKSVETVTHYTDAALRFLQQTGAELNVVACNTASALALPRLLPDSPVPLVGVVEPGAAAAAAAAPAGSSLLVLATEATVASGAYQDACARHGMQAFAKACPLLVPLVEEGWTAEVHGTAEAAVTEQVVNLYLSEALTQTNADHAIAADLEARSGLQSTRPSLILLGCTHYPLLRAVITRAVEALLGPTPVVDAADATAQHVRELLGPSVGEAGLAAEPGFRFFTTDSPAKFQRLGTRFLGRPIPSVTVVDLDR